MSAIRVSACQPRHYVKYTSQSLHFSSKLHLIQINACPLSWNPLNLRAEFRPPSQNVATSKSQRMMPICLAGRGGMMDSDNQGSQWTPFESPQEKFKGQSIEDMLREQIGKKEYFDDRGNGGKPPRGGGGGGNDSGGYEGEAFAAAIHEIIQVVLATIGFIVLYVSLIDGQELIKLLKDYLNYLIRGNKSVRLKRAMYKWERFWKRLMERKGDDRLDDNEKYRRSLKSYMVPDSDQ